MLRLFFFTLSLGALLDLAPLSIRAANGLPLYFEPHADGRTPAAEYRMRGRDYSASIRPADITLRLGRTFGSSPRFQESVGEAGHSLCRLSWIGADPQATLRSAEPLPGRVHSMTGSGPAAWRLGVPTFARLHVDELYPGIGLVYYGNEEQLECDLVVAPGGDPNRIAFTWAGLDHVMLDEAGDLALNTDSGQMHLRRPKIYQTLDGQRRLVEGRYRISQERREVRFEVGPYDSAEALVIDPVVVYSEIKGGSISEYPSSIASDPDGNVYVTGYTFSDDFPTVLPIQGQKRSAPGDPEVFVMKVDPTGKTLLYATFLGGTGGQVASGIAVDASRNAWIVGWTGSTDFPTVNPIQAQHRGGTTDVFVAKLDATGSKLLFSTLLGGSGPDFAAGLALDAAGDVFITGTTGSADLPTVNAIQPDFHGATDAFVAKLDASGSRWQFLTYLGGAGAELGSSIAASAAGVATVTGATTSTNFPLANAWQSTLRGTTDVYVAKFDLQGTSLTFSTLLGGSLDEFSTGIAMGPGGDIWLTGTTASSDFPTLNAFQPAFRPGTCQLAGKPIPCSDAFVTRLASDGRGLVFSSFLGGGAAENPTGALSAILAHSLGIAVDDRGFAYVTGLTSSTDFPTLNSVRSTLDGDMDLFVTKIHPQGPLVFSTYAGGPLQDGGTGISADARGNIYVVGWSERSNGSGTGGGVKRIANRGTQNDILITRLFELPITASPPLGPVGFASSRFGPGKGFETTFSPGGHPGFTIEASTNLVDWVPLKTP